MTLHTPFGKLPDSDPSLVAKAQHLAKKTIGDVKTSLHNTMAAMNPSPADYQIPAARLSEFINDEGHLEKNLQFTVTSLQFDDAVPRVKQGMKAKIAAIAMGTAMMVTPLVHQPSPEKLQAKAAAAAAMEQQRDEQAWGAFKEAMSKEDFEIYMSPTFKKLVRITEEKDRFILTVRDKNKIVGGRAFESELLDPMLYPEDETLSLQITRRSQPHHVIVVSDRKATYGTFADAVMRLDKLGG